VEVVTVRTEEGFKVRILKFNRIFNSKLCSSHLLACLQRMDSESLAVLIEAVEKAAAEEMDAATS
jgi:hypothetical protein